MITLAAVRVTMTDVAVAAGVARSTVSKALRNDSRLPASRCQQIQRIATELGYRPHPMVSALMSQIHRQRRNVDPFYLSWIDFWSSEQTVRSPSFRGELLAGAQARARQLCYQIDVHRVAISRLSLRRLQDILRTRRQWGLIVPPVPDACRDLDLDIQGFASVTIGTSLRSPVMHRISSDCYQGGQLAFDKVVERGFSRIGLVLSRSLNDRNNGRWLAAFLERQQTRPIESRVAPLVIDGDDHACLRHWLRQHRPDVILLAEPSLGDAIRGHTDVNSPAPEMVWLVMDSPGQNVTGLDLQPRLLGALAVDRVVDLIHRNERGMPSISQTLLLESRWVESPPACASFITAQRFSKR